MIKRLFASKYYYLKLKKQMKSLCPLDTYQDSKQK